MKCQMLRKKLNWWSDEAVNSHDKLKWWSVQWITSPNRYLALTLYEFMLISPYNSEELCRQRQLYCPRLVQIYKKKKNFQNKSSPYRWLALIYFSVANMSPLLTFMVEGHSSSCSEGQPVSSPPPPCTRHPPTPERDLFDGFMTHLRHLRFG
jgi:hypothetical protein